MHSGYSGSRSEYNRLQPHVYRQGFQRRQNHQNNQQPDPRKSMAQEWFKMMGGLRSILELGFAAIAIANFYTQLSAMGKKIVAFTKAVLTKTVHFVNKKVFSRMLSPLINAKTRWKTLKSILLNLIRGVSVLLLCLSAKLKSQIKQNSDKQLQKLQQEYNKYKCQNLQIQEVDDNEIIVEPQQKEPMANL